MAKEPHVQGKVSLRQSLRSASRLGRLGLRFAAFFAGFVLAIEKPLGNASEAEGQALVSKPRSQQAW